jgi:hypothetical protein
MTDTPRVASKHRLRKAAIACLCVLAIVGVAVWIYWDQIAVLLAPKKEVAVTRSEDALNADELFWQTFHNGEYNMIPHALDVLTAAYLETPNDAVTAAHIAWLHTWRVTERVRLDSPPPTITDHAILARKYFQEAVALDPSDARYLGFLGAMTMAEGRLHKNERLMREGNFIVRRSIRDWPEFNLFTHGFIMSRMPADSPQFKEGLELQWQSLCECASESIDRGNPDWTKYMSQETTEGRKRACWNSWIAPHNFEGFFLNMGDMLVKAGDWQTARKIYANAKLSRDYADWKFRNVLEERIEHAQANVARFNESSKSSTVRMLIDSEFACMGCHLK